MTAYDGEEVQEKALLIGNAETLAKPFFVSAFKEKITKMQIGQSLEQENLEEINHISIEGLTLLIAEDNEINAEILAELLDIEGATYKIVGNGQLALECFNNAEIGEFDAILMDVQMPVMNGYEATRKIRELKRPDSQKIPIIAMTANAFAEDVKEALDSGMNVHVSKPIDMELLKKSINQCLQRKES